MVNMKMLPIINVVIVTQLALLAVEGLAIIVRPVMDLMCYQLEFVVQIVKLDFGIMEEFVTLVIQVVTLALELLIPNVNLVCLLIS